MSEDVKYAVLEIVLILPADAKNDIVDPKSKIINLIF